MKLRVELSTYYRYNLQACKAILEIYKLGFKNQQLFGHKNVNLKELIKLKRKFNLSFSMHSPFINPHTPDTDWLLNDFKIYKKRVIEDLKLASLLEVDFLVIHPWIIKNQVSKKDYNELIKNIQEICDYGKKRNIIICIENSHSFFPKTAGDMLKLYENIDRTNLKFAFDPSHAMIALKNESKVINFFNRIKKNVLNLHLSNMNIKKDLHKIPKLEKPFFKQIFSKIKKTSIRALTLEIRPEVREIEVMKCMKLVNEMLRTIQ